MHFQDLEETGEIVDLVMDDGTTVPWRRDWFIAMVGSDLADVPTIYRTVIRQQLDTETRGRMDRIDFNALKDAFQKYRDQASDVS